MSSIGMNLSVSAGFSGDMDFSASCGVLRCLHVFFSDFTGGWPCENWNFTEYEQGYRPYHWIYGSKFGSHQPGVTVDGLNIDDQLGISLNSHAPTWRDKNCPTNAGMKTYPQWQEVGIRNCLNEEKHFKHQQTTIASDLPGGDVRNNNGGLTNFKFQRSWPRHLHTHFLDSHEDQVQEGSWRLARLVGWLITIWWWIFLWPRQKLMVIHHLAMKNLP